MNCEAVKTAMSFEEGEKCGALRRASFAQRLRRVLAAGWRTVHGIASKPVRRLRVCESLGLGERRFVAVVEFEQSRFLVGGTSGSLTLLAKLDDAHGDQQQNTPEGNRH